MGRKVIGCMPVSLLRGQGGVRLQNLGELRVRRERCPGIMSGILFVDRTGGVTRMSLELFVLSGLDKNKTFTLNVGPNLMLGRSATAQYQLTDPRVSRNHCQILLEGD